MSTRIKIRQNIFKPKLNINPRMIIKTKSRSRSTCRNRSIYKNRRNKNTNKSTKSRVD